jgi:hypothetical protein
MNRCSILMISFLNGWAVSIDLVQQILHSFLQQKTYIDQPSLQCQIHEQVLQFYSHYQYNEVFRNKSCHHHNSINIRQINTCKHIVQIRNSKVLIFNIIIFMLSSFLSAMLSKDWIENLRISIKEILWMLFKPSFTRHIEMRHEISSSRR